VSGAIAWCGDPGPPGEQPGGPAGRGGRWGEPAALCLPLDDRGLLLGDGLFETVLVQAGRARLLERHLQRWRESAALLAMAPPPGQALVEALLVEALRRGGAGDAALRLNWSRGGGGRGLDLPGPGQPAPTGRFWLSLTPWQPLFSPVRLVLSRWESRNAGSRLSRCKTFAYGGAIQARREAREAGADDALLPSSAGGLCCGTAANLLLRRGGRWWTPPLASGCLPGVMRAVALERGLVTETPLEASDLQAAEGALLINSLGCRPISALDGRPLPPLPAAEAEHFWRALLTERTARPDVEPERKPKPELELELEPKPEPESASEAPPDPPPELPPNRDNVR
jgi:branched-subunit amino acid aminotransferase/4-amino-4-deoxychorismate lyase